MRGGYLPCARPCTVELYTALLLSPCGTSLPCPLIQIVIQQDLLRTSSVAPQNHTLWVQDKSDNVCSQTLTTRRQTCERQAT